MEIRLRTKLIITVAFLLGAFTGVTYGQEPVETSPETAITEETTTTTPETPRIVSQELLTELKSSQQAVEDANKIVQYVVNKILVEYQIDVTTEVINIETGEITPKK